MSGRGVRLASLGLSLLLGGCATPAPPDVLTPLSTSVAQRGSVAIVVMQPWASNTLAYKPGQIVVPQSDDDLVGQYQVIAAFPGQAAGFQRAAAALADHSLAPLVNRRFVEPVGALLDAAGFELVGSDAVGAARGNELGAALLLRRDHFVQADQQGWRHRVDVSPGGLDNDGYGISLFNRDPDPGSLATLAAELEVDHLLLLDVVRIGADKQIGAFFVPSNPAYAIAGMSASLIEVAREERLLSAWRDAVVATDLPEEPAQADAALIGHVEQAGARVLDELLIALRGALR